MTQLKSQYSEPLKPAAAADAGSGGPGGVAEESRTPAVAAPAGGDEVVSWERGVRGWVGGVGAKVGGIGVRVGGVGASRREGLERG